MSPVWPDNVHETGVSPGGHSGSPLVAAEAQQVEPTRTKTWSRAADGGRLVGLTVSASCHYRAFLFARLSSL
jgi:hypothetical protein